MNFSFSIPIVTWNVTHAKEKNCQDKIELCSKTHQNMLLQSILQNDVKINCFGNSDIYLRINQKKRWCTFCAMENFCAMWTPRTLTFWNCIVHQIEAISSNFESNCPQLPTCFTISKRVEMLLSLALLTLLEEQSSSFTFKTKRHSHCPSKTNTRLA